MTVPAITIKKAGPFFVQDPGVVTDRAMDEAQREVAQVAFNTVQAEMAAAFRNPTGYYRSQVRTERVKTDYVVDDSGVIYGPWLEGVSPRNAATRFKGYAHWRRTTQRVNQMAQAIANRVISQYLRRLR